jgi:hypothetical protein
VTKPPIWAALSVRPEAAAEDQRVRREYKNATETSTHDHHWRGELAQVVRSDEGTNDPEDGA